MAGTWTKRPLADAEAYLAILVVVFALQVESVLLDLCVSEGLEDTTAVGSKEVVRHVGVKVEVVRVIDEISENNI